MSSCRPRVVTARDKGVVGQDFVSIAEAESTSGFSNFYIESLEKIMLTVGGDGGFKRRLRHITSDHR